MADNGDDSVEIGWEETQFGPKPSSFCNGLVKGSLGDTVFVRNLNVKDGLNLRNCVIGYLQDFLGDNINFAVNARIVTFLRPESLPSSISVSKFDLNSEFELILDERVKDHFTTVQVKNIFLVRKVLFCSSPVHVPRDSKDFPFFCRYSLTKNSCLRQINIFSFVKKLIKFEICDCAVGLQKSPSSEVDMMKRKVLSEDIQQPQAVLTEKPQNRPVRKSSHHDQKEICGRRRSRVGSREDQFHETIKENVEASVSLKQAVKPQDSSSSCPENEVKKILSPPNNKLLKNNRKSIRKLDGTALTSEINSPCGNKLFQCSEDECNEKGYWASQLLEVSDLVLKDAGQCCSPIKLSLKRIWSNSLPSKEEMKIEEDQPSEICERNQYTISTPRRSKRISDIDVKNQKNPRLSINIDTPRPPRKRNSTVIPDQHVSPIKTPRTAGKTRSSRCATPSMPGRALALKVSEDSLEKARANLHVSAVPAALPCREMEFKNIYRFLEDKIFDAAGGCMYISGMPGTGKTATVHAVVRSLQEKVKAHKLPQFQYVEVNGLRLTEPRQLFVQLLLQLTGQKCAPQQARDILSKRFNSNDKKNDKTCVLLVDEVDMLRNSRQDVVYNLFEWPNLAYSRLVVLTIANTMDLPERLFMGRVTSRVGLTRLTFPAYTYKQLQEIVLSRLEGTSSFNTDAVQFVARKVASISGDARRALDICRRATELVSEGDSITMKTIEQALDQMLNSPNVKAIKACSKFERLFLKAVLLEKERTGIEETNFFSAFRQFKTLCVLDCGVTPHSTQGMAILSKLGSSRLLLTEHSRSDLHQTIYLNVSSDDIHYGLNDNPSQTPLE